MNLNVDGRRFFGLTSGGRFKGRLFFIIKKENMFDFTVHKQG